MFNALFDSLVSILFSARKDARLAETISRAGEDPVAIAVVALGNQAMVNEAIKVLDGLSHLIKSISNLPEREREEMLVLGVYKAGPRWADLRRVAKELVPACDEEEES